MDEHNDSIMIALLPVVGDWSELELPHMTLVYAGKVKDHPLSNFNRMAKDVSSLAILSRRVETRVRGLEVFGGKGQPLVDVYTLELTDQISSMRNFVAKWNASEHPFKPHATIGPSSPMAVPRIRPGRIFFDRIALVWGEEKLTFWLKP